MARRSTSLEIQSTELRARRAVSRFRQMMPTLNAYARAVTGNPKVRIEIRATGGASTQDKIFFQPPIELGDDYRHEKMYCDQRDEAGIQICDACRIHERIMAVIYHEIGHISKGTFDKPTVKDIANLRIKGEALQPGDYGSTWQINHNKLWQQRKAQENGDTLMGLAGTVGPFLPVLFNATEDARVNEQVFRARRGVRAMYEAMMAELVRDGVPAINPDEPNTRWADMSSNPQIILGVYMQLAGYDYSDWLQKEVVDELHNDDLQALLRHFDVEGTGAANLSFTMDVLAQLNKQGLLLMDEPPPKEDDPEDEGESDEENDKGEGGEDGESGSGGGQGDSEQSSGGAGDQPDDSPAGENDGDDDEGSEGSGDESEGDRDDAPGSAGDGDQDVPSDEGLDEPQPLQPLKSGPPLRSQADRDRPYDQEGIRVCAPDQLEPDRLTENQKEMIKQVIEQVVEQMAYFETASYNIEGVHVYKYGYAYDGTPCDGGYGDDDGWPIHRPRVPEINESLLGQALQHLRVTLDANKRASMIRHKKSGKINARVLGKRAPLADDRLFQKKIIPGKRDYFVVIMMDCSGSTSGRNNVLMCNAVYAQAELLHRLGVPFCINGHSTYDNFMSIYEVKTQDQQWDKSTKEALMDVQAVAGNLDGHALEYGRKRADQSNATDVIILYYSDGAMPASNHDEELDILQREIRTCQKKKYTLLGVGIRTDSPKQHGLETVEIHSADDTIKVVRQLEKHLIHR